MSRWAAADIPSQHGRVAIVTGANTGIGFETAAILASHGARVALAVRNSDKGTDARRRIQQRHPQADIAVIALDLTSLASVRGAADDINCRYPKIDLLINNAGVMLTPAARTADGFELQFGTNHLGHFALTGLLLGRMTTVPGSRVVTVSSLGHRVKADIDFSDLHSQRSYDRMTAYGRSKLANLLFTYELQRRLHRAEASTVATAAHPGSARTELVRHSPRWIKLGLKAVEPVMYQSAAMGALPTLRAATDPTADGGELFGPRGWAQQRGYPKAVTSSAQSYDLDTARRLWEASEELTGVHYAL
ncbi:SDR family NAD(P)-dependent oxidoreductase [Mycobacterium sp. 48b]|uniref:SDR family NAD(P)-dependent oxidoreductase n=1 Tax=Mycobacterium sp. 48b TaxID=3400426 RepID=UPI003AAEAB93